MSDKPVKSGPSILATQAAFYLLIILLVSATFGFFFFATAKQHLEREVGRKLQSIAGIAARNTPVERLELIKPGDDESRMVLRLKEKLGEIREAAGVQEIAVFRPDQTLLLALRPGRSIGEPARPKEFPPHFLNALQAGLSVSTGSYPMDSGELFISAYAPVTDNDGRLFAVVAVDAGTREIEVIEQLRSRLYLAAGAGMVIAVLLALGLARTLTRPIRAMARTAERIGRGDYRARVPMPATAELRVLAGSINDMAEQVRRRDAQLKEMSASVAHEIRNPLNSIKLLVALLAENSGQPAGDEAQKTVRTLNYEIGKLNRFLTEFLTYSRPVTLETHDFAPADLARGAVDLVSAEAGSRGITVELSISDDPYPEIHGDRERLEQALLNISLNAVQASPDGGSVRLAVRADASAKTVDFVVEDSGPGIEKEAMDRLFEAFFTTKSAGTGLGLPNTRKIVERHGGEIFAENRARGGARFTIRLPIRPPHAEESPDG
ncbi:MAG: HAMP domain-containing histidine kinase [Deltaproteobacteria bacterium]|nr:HAMP domain-containing histidine kinase [Deltaproteobacteria bacterium]